MSNLYVTIDGLRWWIYGSPRRYVQPICPKHGLRMYKKRAYSGQLLADIRTLSCADCTDLHRLPRSLSEEETYVIDRIDAKNFKKMKFINLDDEALPLAEDKKKTKDEKYFVRAILTESKVGQRLVVYAGEKGRKAKKERTQIFVEPDIKRLAFDQTDMHPSDLFLKLEATFEDGTIHKIEKSKDEK